MPVASTSNVLCRADVSVKKRGLGTLTLTKNVPQALIWEAVNDTAAEHGIKLDGKKINSLFASPANSPKVILRVGVLHKDAPEEFYNFTFTAASSAMSDREHFKREVSALIARHREQRAAAAASGTSTAANGTSSPVNANSPRPGTPNAAKGKGPADPTKDSAIKKAVLEKDAELATLYRELVRGSGGRPGVISDADFWNGREYLLQAEAQEVAQVQGRSAQLVEPRPETTDEGDTKISVTPQLIRDIFEQYPIVQRAYNETVPQRLQEGEFWQRYFSSKLFNRHRASARDAGDSIKDDAIFDHYLKFYDNDLEPDDVDASEVSKTLNLEATAEDHGDTGNQRDYTMRAGANRNALPLIRRFNERSERLLDDSLGDRGTKRQRTGIIDGGDAGSRNYYAEIELEDLKAQEEEHRIILDMQDQQRYFQGRAEDLESMDVDPEEAQRIFEATKHRFADWTPDLGGFRVSRRATAAAVSSVFASLKARQAGREGVTFSKEALSQMTSLQAATNEFLRQFWAAVLPPRTDDLSANALASPKERFDKATRLKGFLEKTAERIQAVVASAPEEERDRVAEAVKPLQGAAEWAVQWYRENAPSKSTNKK